MGYGEAPWVFKGKALYQLQLVPSSEARKYIPDCFQLVELFGYTLGGFYLARYEDSPVGAFEELVALAGLVWNAPSSCAWAARVYVNNREARDHGLRSVGLPSRLAQFTEQYSVSDGPTKGSSWWSNGESSNKLTKGGSLCITNIDNSPGRRMRLPVCTMMLPPALPTGAWAGPRINLVLPSFSGGTPNHPALLKYSCDLTTSVRLVPPASVTTVLQQDSNTTSDSKRQGETSELMSSVLGGRPVLAMVFDSMVMSVEEPIVVCHPNTPSEKNMRLRSNTIASMERTR